MQHNILTTYFLTFNRWYQTPSVKNIITIIFIGLSPILAGLTFYSFDFFAEANKSTFLRNMLLLDLVYVLIMSGLVLLRVTRLIIARRSKSAGSRLHFRLTAVFIFMALLKNYPLIT